MIDAKELIEKLENDNKELSEMVKKARIALDADCDHCDRW